jgi:hypothetical protein
MSSRRSALIILLAGFVTFGVVFMLLEFSRSQAAPTETLATPPPVSTAAAVAADSITPGLRDGELAVGVPIAGYEVLLRDVQPGDRLDILASLSSAKDSQPITAVVVRGATVLRLATATDTLLVEVAGRDALALAHLVLSGTRLGYVVWAPGAVSDGSQTSMLDETTARRLLGLSGPSATAATPEPRPTPLPTYVPRTDSGFLYQVQAGDTWSSIAATFGRSVEQIRTWNEASNDADPVPGRLVFIPRMS